MDREVSLGYQVPRRDRPERSVARNEHRGLPLQRADRAGLGEFGGCPFTYDASQPETATNKKPVSTIIKDVAVDPADPLSAIVHFLIPAATFADTLAGLPVESPATLDLHDPTGTKAKNDPVGTGAFAFKEWTPNDHLTVVKNPNYWQKGLPYLDSIIFKPINDVSARENTLRGGTVDMIMNFQGPSIAKFRAEKEKWSIFENAKGGDTGLIMLNHFPTYKGKENPVADLRVRQALSLAIDYKEVLDLRQENVSQVANGPYTPGVPGYLADTGWPTAPDIAKAKSLIDDYKKEKGISGDLDIEYGTDADPFNRGTNELIATYFKEIGVNAVIDQTEQGQYITRPAGRLPDVRLAAVRWLQSRSQLPLVVQPARHRPARYRPELRSLQEQGRRRQPPHPAHEP